MGHQEAEEQGLRSGEIRRERKEKIRRIFFAAKMFMYTWQQTGSVVAEETNCAGFGNATVRNQNLKKNKNLGFFFYF